MPRGRLALESGVVHEGWLFGAPLTPATSGEVVFNTCMTGYQEICTDPSYAGQMVVMTYPLIGNYGVRDDHAKSGRMHCRALIVRELSERIGHGAADRSLDDELRRQGVPGLRGVDTRALTRHLRDRGTLRGVIALASALTSEAQVELARRAPWVSDRDLVAEVSQTEPWVSWEEVLSPELERGVRQGGGLGRFRGTRIVTVDLGLKRNQLRALASRGAEVVTVRHDVDLDSVMRHRPQGVVLSNGPGDPSRLPGQVRLARQLLELGVPILGICLGHQVLGQAAGATTSRLGFGHHGGNHPVRDELSGAVYVTSQNHEFQVDAQTLPPESAWFVSERNLNDGSVEGLRHRSLPVISVQYHPEGAPGPQDRAQLFDEFLTLATAYGDGVAELCADGAGGPEAGASAERSTSPVPPSPPERPRCVLVIGSGPIIIGQAAEFDYAGTQACKALREEGIRVVLVNSNPATIMTDDQSADAVYIEPLTVPLVERIIAAERPDALLATLGGQTGLNLAVALEDAGVLERYGVRPLGTPLDAIRTAEDRERFKELIQCIGEPAPESRTVDSLAGARRFLAEVGFPWSCGRPSPWGAPAEGCVPPRSSSSRWWATGSPSPRSARCWSSARWSAGRRSSTRSCGTRPGPASRSATWRTSIRWECTPATPSWSRRRRRSATSTTSMLRSAALRIISALGIAGGCNVQFALAPDASDYHIIEVNPRVSRSSALASKATGYPIARLAAKIAAGRRLDEIPNAVTGKTYAAFEPALDYCVVKIPRWPFDKFPEADRRLGTQMKSTGEVMAIERSFEAAFSKALRSLEQRPPAGAEIRDPVLLDNPNDRRIFAVMEALRGGASVEEVSRRSTISVWFVDRLRALVQVEEGLRNGLDDDTLTSAKRMALSDRRIAELAGLSPTEVAGARRRLALTPTFKCVDTCAAEFAAATPYYYSTVESEDERPAPDGDAVVVLGSGPIRIGQGIEFDYCSVQAAEALRLQGVAAIMVNSNPETVSTDFDCSTRLYFEPLDQEAVLAVIEAERASGVVVQFGGQTAINLAEPLDRHGVRILGTTVDAIDLAEDRRRFEALMRRLEIPQSHGAATIDPAEAAAIADRIGYPVLVRPSFVLGGRAMEVVHSRDQLQRFVAAAMAALPEDGDRVGGSRGTVLVDKYLFGTEIDVDAVSDGETVVIPGLMEHVERAGVHSGDSMAAYPAPGLDAEVTRRIVADTVAIARALPVRGLCNIQFVIWRGLPRVLEVNPRASRTVPFISKVTGVPMVELATRVMRGERLADLGFDTGLRPPLPLVAVKAPVFSTVKLALVNSALGPEMKSTGEVMGIDTTLGAAVEKAFVAALGAVPTKGAVLCSIADGDKAEALPIMAQLSALGFGIFATAGTAAALSAAGVSATAVGRIGQSRPNVLDIIEEGRVSLVVNTVSNLESDELSISPSREGGLAAAGRTVKDGYRIRLAAEHRRIPCCTSIDTAQALVDAITRQRRGAEITVAPVRAYRAGGVAAVAG